MEIVVTVSGKSRTFIHDNITFVQHLASSTRPIPPRSLEIPIRQVIAASFDVQKHVLSVTYLQRKKKEPLSIVIADGVVAEEQKEQGAKFVESILDSAYQGSLEILLYCSILIV